jgi:hypothetical protein
LFRSFVALLTPEASFRVRKTLTNFFASRDEISEINNYLPVEEEEDSGSRKNQGHLQQGWVPGPRDDLEQSRTLEE